MITIDLQDDVVRKEKSTNPEKEMPCHGRDVGYQTGTEANRDQPRSPERRSLIARLLKVIFKEI